MEDTSTKTYKCPSCGASLIFDSKSGKMHCEYCGTELETDEFEEMEETAKSSSEKDDFSWETYEAENYGGSSSDDENMSVYICQSCGGEIITDKNTSATRCPYCDNQTIIPSRLTGTFRPDLIIPFKIDKESAKKTLRDFYKGKTLLPKLFRSENRIESIDGIYVPFWLFSAGANADITYKATRTTVWKDSKYNYTKTSHFRILRSGSLDFENIPVDGSKKMSDRFMEAIEPYDTDKAVPFNSAYLSGFLSDKYDVSSKEAQPRANERLKNTTEQIFRDTVQNYTSVVYENSRVNIVKSRIKYALLPVWLLNTNYKGKIYTFAMNGQTGKMVGELPVDMKKYLIWLFSLFAASGSLTWFLLSLFL